MRENGRYVKIDGSPGFVKDYQTGAILNINTRDIERARQIKNARKEQSHDIDLLKDDVKQMKSDLSDIKNLLQQMVGK